jgi:hypothetical protein
LRTLILPVLIGLPLAAQLSINSVEVNEARFLQSVRKSSRPHLLVFENNSKPIMASVRKLLQEEGIADLGLVPMALHQERELAIAAQRRFRLAPNTRWAVINSKEQCLASGQTVPKADEFAQALAAKGIQSPIRVLREFIKTHPDHLEARMELLGLQQRSAEERSRAALGLEIGDQADNLPVQRQRADTGSTIAMMLRAGGNEFFGYRRPKPKPIPADKVLGTAVDLQIWGGYAESFDRLLTGDDWIIGGLSFNNSDAPLEVCSPLVKGLYKRKIGQVEAALERAPVNTRLWSVWIRMADVIGNKNVQEVVDRLTQRPGSGFSSWPNAVRKRLIDEARQNSRWNYAADYLWSEYENELIIKGNIKVNMDSNATKFNQNQNEVLRRTLDSLWAEQWDNLFEPLLEALIRMNDLGRADAVLNVLRKGQQQGQLSETQMLKAVALANRCDRPDIARSWSAYLKENNAVN